MSAHSCSPSEADYFLVSWQVWQNTEIGCKTASYFVSFKLGRFRLYSFTCQKWLLKKKQLSTHCNSDGKSNSTRVCALVCVLMIVHTLRYMFRLWEINKSSNNYGSFVTPKRRRRERREIEFTWIAALKIFKESSFCWYIAPASSRHIFPHLPLKNTRWMVMAQSHQPYMLFPSPVQQSLRSYIAVKF